MSTLMSTDMVLNRPTTKVHAPPGGKTSISFGGDEPAHEAPAPKKTEVAHTAPVAEKPAPAPAPEPQKLQTSNSGKVQTTTSGGNNEQVHTSVKVRAPPGGKSSITFG